MDAHFYGSLGLRELKVMLAIRIDLVEHLESLTFVIKKRRMS